MWTPLGSDKVSVFWGLSVISGRHGSVNYRRSGNFRVKNISSVKFSTCLIFVAGAHRQKLNTAKITSMSRASLKNAVLSFMYGPRLPRDFLPDPRLFALAIVWEGTLANSHGAIRIRINLHTGHDYSNKYKLQLPVSLQEPA